MTRFRIKQINRIISVSVVMVLLSGGIINAQAMNVEADYNNGPYHLFNPAPRQALRPLAPEPHPFTTDPGWFQLEFDPINYTRNRDGSERTRAYEVPVLLKIGLLENVDFHIGADAFVWERTRDRAANEVERDRGFGDLTLGSKINIWGNDGGDSALAVNPFAVLPTARHDMGPGGVEGGLLIPTFWAVSEQWELEFTPSIAAVRNADDDGYVAELGQLSVLSTGLTAETAWFAEFESIITAESGQSWEPVAATGVTWDISEDTVVETGVGFGLNSATDDMNVFMTVVQRF